MALLSLTLTTVAADWPRLRGPTCDGKSTETGLLKLRSIFKVVSGGQTGADIGAIEAAIYCKLDWGGWIPKGRKSENGRIPAKSFGADGTATSVTQALALVAEL